MPPIPDDREVVGNVPAASTVQPGGSATLLVVEDEQAVWELACRVLRGLGYGAIAATDGASALAILEREAAIDLLLADVVLPGGITRPELARRAAARRRALKVLYTSGYTGNPSSSPMRSKRASE